MDDFRANGDQKEARVFWMGVLARASLKELRAALSLAQVELPAVDVVKAAETGTLMLEGRAGGGATRLPYVPADPATRAVLEADLRAAGLL